MLKSKFYELNHQKALKILQDLPSTLKAKLQETKTAMLKTVFPSINMDLIKTKLEENQVKQKQIIKAINKQLNTDNSL